VFIALPLLPARDANVTGGANESLAETVGWPHLADQVAAIVHQLPADEQPHVVLVGGTYGEAGALARFGPSRGLPRAYSGHNSYFDFGRPTDDRSVVVAVRMRPESFARWFDDCRVVAHVDNGLGVDNEVQGEPIVVCHGQRAPWSRIWPTLRHLS
jgi:hypothetical protein